MDIHPPEHPIRSVRDFLMQIFTVTCGIVIALGLEGLVENYQHAALRRQAANDFTTEIAANRASMEQFIKRAEPEEAGLVKLIVYGTARLSHQPATMAGDITTRGFTILGSNAWQNAVSTQAIDQFDYRTARALAAAYDKQAVFNDFEVKARDQWIGIAAFGDVKNLTDDETRLALRALRVAYAYQHSIRPLAAELVDTYGSAQAELARGR